jgi:hypothetical protein
MVSDAFASLRKKTPVLGATAHEHSNKQFARSSTLLNGRVQISADAARNGNQLAARCDNG